MLSVQAKKECIKLLFLHRCKHSPHLLHVPASLLFTHLRGQLHAPPPPSAGIHTQQNHIHPSVAPASLLFLTVPQCPPSAGLYGTLRVSAREDHCRLSVFSLYLLSTSVTSTLFILWLRTQFDSPFPISHMPHNCFLLIFWSVLFTTHQGAITRP